MKYNLLTALMITCIILVGYRFLKDGLLITFCKQESTIDNKTYKVQCSYDDKQYAANLLSQLNDTSQQLINYIHSKYGDKNNSRGRVARNLKKRYHGRSRMVETDPDNGKDNTSYVINKGILLSLCLRNNNNKEESSFHKLNILKFVLIHELSHISCDFNGHPIEFWMDFKFLLNEAMEAGLYDYHNFEENPIHYCSLLNITYTPTDDDSLPNLD